MTNQRRSISASNSWPAAHRIQFPAKDNPNASPVPAAAAITMRIPCASVGRRCVSSAGYGAASLRPTWLRLLGDTIGFEAAGCREGRVKKCEKACQLQTPNAKLQRGLELGRFSMEFEVWSLELSDFTLAPLHLLQRLRPVFAQQAGERAVRQQASFRLA